MKLLSIPSSSAFIGYKFYWRILLLILVWLGIHTYSQAQWQKAVSNTASNLVDVSYDNGLWIAVGANGTIVTSPDGITWTVRNSTTIQTLKAVSYGGGQWIAVGDNRTILTSPDGISWTPQSSTVAQHYSDVGFVGGDWRWGCNDFSRWDYLDRAKR